MDDKQEFDVTCKRIKEIDDQLETLNDERKGLWTKFETLFNGLEGEEVNGRKLVHGPEYGAIMEKGRRKVGKNTNLPALEEISHALVKHVEGRFEFTSHMPDKLMEIKALSSGNGFSGEVTDPVLKPLTLTEVESFMKDNPKLNRQRAEIMGYMDVQHGKGTLVIFNNHD